MRKRIVAGNWKMNNLSDEAKQLIKDINDASSVKADKLIVIPPSVFIEMAVHTAKENVSVGAQNCYFEPSGAFTGEISAAMLKSIGTEYCLVGHSERRQLFGESNEIVSKKFNAVIDNELIPILCCGETLDERRSGKHKEIVEQQIRSVITRDHGTREFIVAYEPVWAIGTGETATSVQAQEMHVHIRSILNDITGNGDNISILYGGSCNPSNSVELFAQADIDGGLIGGASLVADSFIQIANSWD